MTSPPPPPWKGTWWTRMKISPSFAGECERRTRRTAPSFFARTRCSSNRRLHTSPSRGAPCRTDGGSPLDDRLEDRFAVLQDDFEIDRAFMFGSQLRGRL